jgi:dCMP deaminase
MIDKNYSWDVYFLDLAKMVSGRSKDVTKHGCVLVDAKRRIISTGYNGGIAGMDDSIIPTTRPDKYFYYCHSEISAIIFARRDLTDCTAYITGFPCSACFLAMAQAGIRRIVIGEQESKCVDNEMKGHVLKQAVAIGAEITQIKNGLYYRCCIQETQNEKI